MVGEASHARAVAAGACLSAVGMAGGLGAVVLRGSAVGWHLFLASFAAWLAAFVLGFLIVWDRGALDR